MPVVNVYHGRGYKKAELLLHPFSQGEIFPEKYSSQIQALKTSSGLGKVQTSTTQTSFQVEAGTDCHIRLSHSWNPVDHLCRSLGFDGFSRPRLPSSRQDAGCVLSSLLQAVSSLPTAPGFSAPPSSFPSPPPYPQSLPRDPLGKGLALPLACPNGYPALPNLGV